MSDRKRVYTWEFPVRFTHWINALSILTLAATGIYIGAPFIHAVSTKQYIMGTVRVVHFIAGYVMLCSFAIRIYWAFMGNRYASWKVWFPFTGTRLRHLKESVKFYTFITRKPPLTIGHTALGGFTYFLVFLIIGFMITSGFALHSVSSQSGIASATGGWMLGLMHLQTIRLYHHLGMYAIMFFVIIHIYIAWWSDVAERNSILGSMFSGYKFVTGKEWE